MPRRVSDYPDAFTGWNFISSIGSIISVGATALFLHIVYLQLVKGKAVFGYPWAVPQLFSDYLRILKDKTAPGLEWALHNPPKPHAFTSLPLQSGMDADSVATALNQFFILKANAVQNSTSAIQNCAEHAFNMKVEASQAELASGQVPDCDFNPQDRVKHPAIFPTWKEFYACSKCYAVTCLNCLHQNSMLLITNGNIFFILLSNIRKIISLLVNFIKLNYTTISKFFILLGIFADAIYTEFYYNVYCDAPRAWGLYFQDSASPQMEALVELHDNIMFYLVGILLGVAWIQGAIIKNFESSKSPISNKYLTHGTLIELIWTITPALILVLIAFPSFKLLYLMDEVTDPSLSVLAEGHQWYWSYEYPDFLNSDGDFVEFDSYLVPESDLEEGSLRMLEVDNRVILPEITHTRFILTAADVIHSFAIPALGVKCDAYPGRLNQFSVLINRLGTFYGQCSEICGILHSSMPIVVESVPLVKFLSWLQEQ
jgi:cytochrome c oxidase subunit 2